MLPTRRAASALQSVVSDQQGLVPTRRAATTLQSVVSDQEALVPTRRAASALQSVVSDQQALVKRSSARSKIQSKYFVKTLTDSVNVTSSTDTSTSSDSSSLGNMASNSCTVAAPPPLWERVLENIRDMRSARDAPVDTMGANKCFDENSSPKVSLPIAD